MNEAAPYGTYAPNSFQKTMIGLTRALPENWLGKRLGFVLRKTVHGGRKTPMDISVYNQNLRLHPYDNRCEKRVICMPQFFDNAERFALRDFAKSKGEAGFSFIDLGANVGLYSLYLSGLGLKNLRIVAVEADPYIFQRLAYNIQNNPQSALISLYNIAVADQDGTLTLNINPKNRGENSLSETKGSDFEKINVPAKTLLSLMDGEGLQAADAIKLDLEGAEDPVLTTFFKTAPIERYPTMIVIEDAPKRWAGDLFALLEKSGYDLYQTTDMNRVYVLKSRFESLHSVN